MVVYKTTNLINGKKYIGMDSHNNPKYLGSGTAFLKAIKKYGRNNFKKEILEYCSSIDELEKRETYWINYYDAIHDKNFYNLSDNRKRGINPFINKTKEELEKIYSKINVPQRNKKISEANKGKPKPLGFGNTNPNPKKGSSKPRGFKNRISPSKGKNWKWKDKLSNHILQYDLEGNFIKEWPSIIKAVNITRIKGISECLNNRTKTSGGYIWKKYIENYPKKLTEEEINLIKSRKPVYNKDKNKPFMILNQNLEIIYEFKSLKEASDVLGKHISNISSALSNKKKNYLKLIWKYK